MSQDFLSQEEVDALLKGVTGETDDAHEEHVDPGGGQSHDKSNQARAYDLGRQERIVRGRMPTLEMVNERFMRNLRIGLFSYMHRHIEIMVSPIRVQKYSEFVRNLIVPTNLNLVQIKPLRGTGLFVFDPNLIFLVVDNMFGGDGRFHTRVEGRDFTATEQRIIQGLLKTAFTEYEKAWHPIYPITCEYVRSEMNTQFANIATPSEVVVAVTFTIEFSGAASEMHICLPYSMIEPIRDLLNSTLNSEQQAVEDKRWISLLRSQLKAAEVELVVPLGETTLSLRDIMELKAGDVLPLDIHETLIATIDDFPALKAKYGVRNGQYALKVEGFASLRGES